MPTKICPTKLLRAPSSRSSVVLLSLSLLHSSVSQDPAGGLSLRGQGRATSSFQAGELRGVGACKVQHAKPQPFRVNPQLCTSVAETSGQVQFRGRPRQSPPRSSDSWYQHTLHCGRGCSWKIGQLFHLYGRCARNVKSWTKLWSSLPFSYTGARTGRIDPSKCIQFLYLVQIPSNLRPQSPAFLAVAVTFE